MSYLLYTLSNKTIRISPQNLRSTNENEPLPDEIIELLESEQYKNILNYFLWKLLTKKNCFDLAHTPL